LTNNVIHFTKAGVTLHEKDICVTNTIIYFGLYDRFTTEQFGHLHPVSSSYCDRLNAYEKTLSDEELHKYMEQNKDEYVLWIWHDTYQLNPYKHLTLA